MLKKVKKLKFKKKMVKINVKRSGVIALGGIARTSNPRKCVWLT